MIRGRYLNHSMGYKRTTLSTRNIHQPLFRYISSETREKWKTAGDMTRRVDNRKKICVSLTEYKCDRRMKSIESIRTMTVTTFTFYRMVIVSQDWFWFGHTHVLAKDRRSIVIVVVNRSFSNWPNPSSLCLSLFTLAFYPQPLSFHLSTCLLFRFYFRKRTNIDANHRQ